MSGTDDVILQDDKVIHNPVTGSDYLVREHSSKYGSKKVIKGLWKETSKTPIKNIDEKGPILPYLSCPLMIHPLKIRMNLRKSLVMCRSALRGHLEKIGVTFSVTGAFFVALPATMFNTLFTNVFFFIGDIFLLSIFALEKRNWLIVQNSIFAVLAFWGIMNNYQVMM